MGFNKKLQKSLFLDRGDPKYVQFGYSFQKKKGLTTKYLNKITGYSRAQLSRHIRQYREEG
jgi:hypothetical protein